MEAGLSAKWQSDEWSKGPCHAVERSALVLEIIITTNAKHLGELLKGGWDVNESLQLLDLKTTIEDGVTSYSFSTALSKAQQWGWEEGVAMLLDAGAKWHYDFDQLLRVSVYSSDEASLAVFKSIINYAEGINWNEDNRTPILHHVLCRPNYEPPAFLLKHLDFFYQIECNVNLEDGRQKTALEYGVRNNCHSNSIRWLLRHGANTCAMKVTLLKHQLLRDTSKYHCPEIPLILLQAGLRVTYGVQTKLTNMLVAIEASMQEDVIDDESIRKKIDTLWAQLEKAEDEERAEMQFNSKKKIFPEDRSQQMVDLQGFSDRYLHEYPEDIPIEDQSWQHAVEQIRKVQEFLSQTQSLQWHCRRCVRENLMSLAPSVVKTLPVPARLKQYILCHEL